MDQIKDPPNSDLQILFLSMPPSVRGILNDGFGGYDVPGEGRADEVQEGLQHLLLVSISSLYAVSLFGCGRPTI